MKVVLVLILSCLAFACGTSDQVSIDDETVVYEQVLTQFLNTESFQQYFLQEQDGISDPTLIADDEIRSEGDRIGEEVATGIYIFRIQDGISSVSRKMILLK